MQKHTKIYMRYYGYGEQDFIPCLECGTRSTEVHHLLFRSHGGKNNIENLVALCRKCHDKAHQSREFNNYLKHLNGRNFNNRNNPQ